MTYLGKDTKAAIEAAAPRDAAGRPIDPNTRMPIDGKPDIGHKTGSEFRREKAAAEAEASSPVVPKMGMAAWCRNSGGRRSSDGGRAIAV